MSLVNKHRCKPVESCSDELKWWPTISLEVRLRRLTSWSTHTVKSSRRLNPVCIYMCTHIKTFYNINIVYMHCVCVSYLSSNCKHREFRHVRILDGNTPSNASSTNCIQRSLFPTWRNLLCFALLRQSGTNPIEIPSRCSHDHLNICNSVYFKSGWIHHLCQIVPYINAPVHRFNLAMTVEMGLPKILHVPELLSRNPTYNRYGNAWYMFHDSDPGQYAL